MAQWDGKSKGTLLGYKIFVYFIKKFGVYTAYSVLIFVAAYYYLSSWKTNKSLYFYLHKQQKHSLLKTLIGIYKSYFTFGMVLIDKIAIGAGLRDKYTYNFDGIDLLKKLLSEGKGGILISAHVGNFEIAERFFGEIDFDCPINLIATDMERNVIKEYLERIASISKAKFIIMKDDMSHIFEINKALSQNELICFTGDRYFEHSKTMESVLLEDQALFPAGPFQIASRLKVPVAFVYVMKEPNLHYHLYAREAVVKHRDAQGLLVSYCQSVASILKKYPYQWFNFFNFWNNN